MSPLVLVAEDDPDLRSLLRHVLEADGHEVRLAGDGREALDLIREAAPDLVVLDLMMPRLSGFEVLRELRRPGDTAVETPVLVLSARASEVDVLSGFELGAADYMTKPFIVGELCARVRLLLGRSRAAEAMPVSAGEQQA